jgi:hypothetical protein
MGLGHSMYTGSVVFIIISDFGNPRFRIDLYITDSRWIFEVIMKYDIDKINIDTTNFTNNRSCLIKG